MIHIVHVQPATVYFIVARLAGLVTNGTVQTASLAVIYLVDIVLLCMLRPFSNSVVQWVETVLVRLGASQTLSRTVAFCCTSEVGAISCFFFWIMTFGGI